MGRNIYQLVAIDKDGVEHVIGIKNRNKQNKTHLSLIDYGTSFFESEAQMRYYFETRKENFPTNCNFKIKYVYDGEVKYLNCIYNEPFLKEEIRKRYLKKDGIFEKINTKQTEHEQRSMAYKLFDEIEKLLIDENFYTSLVLYEKNRLGMSNILNQKLQESLHKYTYLFNSTFLNEEDIKEKNDLKHSIIRELEQYKQYRTLYWIVKTYKMGELKLDIETLDDEKKYIEIMKSEEKKEGTWDFGEKINVPEDVQYRYEKGGMDEVYQNFDLDDLIGKGLRR